MKHEYEDIASMRALPHGRFIADIYVILEQLRYAWPRPPTEGNVGPEIRTENSGR